MYDYPEKRDYDGNLRGHLKVVVNWMKSFSEVMDMYREYEVITVTKTKNDEAELWLRLKPEEDRFVDEI